MVIHLWEMPSTQLCNLEGVWVRLARVKQEVGSGAGAVEGPSKVVCRM